MRTVLEVWMLDHNRSQQLQHRYEPYYRPIVVPEPYQAGREHMPVHPWTNIFDAFDWSDDPYYGWWTDRRWNDGRL